MFICYLISFLIHLEIKKYTKVFDKYKEMLNCKLKSDSNFHEKKLKIKKIEILKIFKSNHLLTVIL